jgi:hypothetical protein
MNSNNFAVDLNFPELPFLGEFPTVEINNEWDSIKIPLDTLNPKFINFLKSKNIEVYDNCMLFGTKGNGKSLLHVDSDSGTHNLSYINYAYGSNDHEMCWFDIDQKEDASIDISESLLKVFDDSRNYKMLCRHAVKFPSLVKIGFPHQIFNYDSKPRYCASIAVIESHRKSKKINGYDGIDFDWALENLKNYIIK